MIEREHGIRSGGAFAWFMQRISGAVLLLVLILHFWILHFFPSGAHGEITYKVVMERLSHPVWRTVDLLFLMVGLYHGMNGVILIVHDYIRHSQWRILIIGVLWIAALFFLIIGSLTIFSLPGRAV